MSNAIHIENLCKEYQIIPHRTGSLREEWKYLWSPGSGKKEKYLALDRVNLDIEQGSAVGIIGRNGAGKTTLLKILSRITAPSSGRVEMNGRVSSLLEVGTGFHPELSGRENIFLNGAILGMKRTEIRKHFDAIVDFSGVEKFLETPVKHYSSGMYVRLAFAVAAHLQSDILLIDEVLAVGDIEFQKRCLGKMGEMADSGRTVLFVSHNLSAVENLCNSVTVIQNGVASPLMHPGEGIRKYLEQQGDSLSKPVGERTDRQGSQKVILKSLSIYNEQKIIERNFRRGDNVLLALKYNSNLKQIEHVAFNVDICSESGEILFSCNTRYLHGLIDKLPGSGEILCEIPNLPLTMGRYILNVIIVEGNSLCDSIEGAADFRVLSDEFDRSIQMKRFRSRISVDHNWTWS